MQQYWINAMNEESKFLKSIGKTNLPSSAVVSNTNLLHSTVLDEEEIAKAENEHTIISSPKTSLRCTELSLLQHSDEILPFKVENQSFEKEVSLENQNHILPSEVLLIHVKEAVRPGTDQKVQ